MSENQDSMNTVKKKNLKKIIPIILIGVAACCITSVVIGALSDLFSPENDVTDIFEVPTKMDNDSVLENTPVSTEAPEPKYPSLEYILQNDRSYSDAGTFKVMWDILVDPEQDEITEENLRELMNHLYDEAYSLVPPDDRPKVIAVYVYTSMEYLLTGSQWIGMSTKSGGASEPSISINDRQLESLYSEEEELLGLSETERKNIFNEIVHAEDRATAEADAAYPDMDPAEEYFALVEELELKYKTELANDFGLTLDQLQEISLEGLQKDWPLPTPISK